MAPARKRKARPSTAASIDFLNNVSRAAPHKPSQDDSIWDIPSSPEPPKDSPRISQPTPSPLRRPRTRSHKNIPSPEPEAIEEREEEPPTPDAIDDQDEEEVGFFPSEAGEEQISGPNDFQIDVEMPESDDQAFDAPDDSASEELVLFSSEGEEGEEEEEEEEAENDDEMNINGHPEEGPGDNSSVFSRNSRQIVPSRSSIEVVIENAPEHSYLSHGYAETIMSDAGGQHQEEMAEDDLPEQQQEKRIDPNVQYLRELRHWFVREVKKTSVEQDWNKLNESGRAVKQYASWPRPEYLEDLHHLFTEYRNLYKEAAEPSNLSRGFWIQLKNVKEYIVTEVRQLFEHASETLQEPSILDQFEAHFVPKMTILAQLGFKVYRETDGNAHGQLYDALDLLSVCMGLIRNYMELLKPAYRSRTLVYPLRRVIKALEMGQLRANRPGPRNGNHHGTTILPRINDWTLDEERALRNGMVKYVDSDTPFLMIAKYLGHKFQRRSIRDMEGKARALGLIS